MNLMTGHDVSPLLRLAPDSPQRLHIVDIRTIATDVPATAFRGQSRYDVCSHHELGCDSKVTVYPWLSVGRLLLSGRREGCETKANSMFRRLDRFDFTSGFDSKSIKYYESESAVYHLSAN